MIKNREKNQVFKWSKIGYFPFTIENCLLKMTLFNFTINELFTYLFAAIFSIKI